MLPRTPRLFRRSVSLSLPLLLVATTLCGQKPSGGASLHQVMEYEPWQHALLVTLLTGTIALAVIFALHNRKSRKLIDMHRSLKDKLRTPAVPRANAPRIGASKESVPSSVRKQTPPRKPPTA